MLDWTQIDTVFLDMDGVLLDLHFDNYFWLDHLPKRYAELQGRDPVQTRADLHQRFLEIRGTLNWYCLEYWQQQLQVDIVALKREVSDRIKLRSGVDEFITQLRERNVHIALVSNAHRWSIDLKVEAVLPAQYFDAIHSSHDFGFPKEEQNFWRAFQNAYSFDSGSTLFIDDNEQVLESAKNFGIAHLRSIRSPDSQREPQSPGRFLQLNSFGEVFD